MCFYKFMGVSEIFKLRGGVPQPVAVMEARGGALMWMVRGEALAEAFPPRPETKKANKQQQPQPPPVHPQPLDCVCFCLHSFCTGTIVYNVHC